MGFRFRRRLSVLPGLWLNLSKSGVSTSLGGRGLTWNLSRRGRRTTVGLPGTGLSWRSPTRPWSGSEEPPAPAAAGQRDDAPQPHPARGIVWVVLVALAIGVALGVILALAILRPA